MNLAQLCRQNLLAPDYLAAVEYYDELPSTSDHALELATTTEAPRPLLVVAERQTAGRGRGSNRWLAGEGALTFSLLCDATISSLPPERQPLVSLAAGLAIQRALAVAAPGAEIGVKWPNDVWLNERKVAGILVEARAAAQPAVVIGIGINVNNSFAAMPTSGDDPAAELRGQATALCDETGRQHDPAQLLESVLTALAEELAALAAGRLRLCERWPQVCVLSGRQVRIETGRQSQQGWCRGVDESGALLLDDGLRVQRCVAGTVAFIEQR